MLLEKDENQNIHIKPSTQPEGYVKCSKTFQMLEGFGGSIAYDPEKLVIHDTKDVIYDLLFRDLGLDFIRIRNTYDHAHKTNLSVFDASVEIFKSAKIRNQDVKSFLVAWSPAHYVKNNNDEFGGTLKKSGTRYVYDEYADWWKKSIEAFSNNGVSIDYMSIQNEPDYDTDYDACRMDPVENENYPGYKEALNAVCLALKNKDIKILGPETIGLGISLVYSKVLDLNNIYGFSHHLYPDGNPNSECDQEYRYDHPDEGYSDQMSKYYDEMKNLDESKKIFMTEFARRNEPTFEAAIKMGWHMHNCFNIEQVNSYMAWTLFRYEKSPGAVTGGFIKMKNDGGYEVRDLYYTMKHFAKGIKPGWLRIESHCPNQELRMTAFKSPDSGKITIVISNVSDNDSHFKISVNDYKIGDSAIYQTTSGEKWKYSGTFNRDNRINLPGKSITTIALGVDSL